MDMVVSNDKNRHHGYPEHVSLKEALELLLGEFGPMPERSESLDISEALGRELSENVVSRRNVPHYTASAVDGYAIFSGDTSGGSHATPALLSEPDFEWVNTGMPVDGQSKEGKADKTDRTHHKEYDSVVMVEDTSISDEGGERRLKVFKSLTQGENVRAVGEDVMNGQIIAIKGDRVTPALMSLLLCAGVESVKVRVLPRALFIPTGNEIVGKDEWLSGGDIPPGVVVDSNSEYARSIFAEWGYSLDVSPILPDDPKAIREAVGKSTGNYDLVLVSAGSAKGKRDHSAEVFASLGKMLFRYVRMKPGRPVMAASINGRPVICTPGFPMSCAVSLWSLVYPLMKRLSGELGEQGQTGGELASDPIRYIPEAIGSDETVEAKLMMQHSSPQGVADWLRMKLAKIGGELVCWPLSAGASVLWALSESDGIALIPESFLECERGSKVLIHLTKSVNYERRLFFQGSDDPAVQLLISIIRSKGMDFVIRTVGSMGGLAALGRGEAHLAAAHLLDASDGSYNTSYIERFASGRKWDRKLIFHREQGLITARGNPKGIKSIEDLSVKRVVFENRQPGAGTRVLLDYMLGRAGLRPSDISGYERQSITHMEAANKVASGVADATLGIKTAADALGLDFAPIAHEPYELVFMEGFDEHPAAGVLFESLESDEWRASVEKMGGYEWPK